MDPSDDWCYFYDKIKTELGPESEGVFNLNQVASNNYIGVVSIARGSEVLTFAQSDIHEILNQPGSC